MNNLIWNKEKYYLDEARDCYVANTPVDFWAAPLPWRPDDSSTYSEIIYTAEAFDQKCIASRISVTRKIIASVLDCANRYLLELYKENGGMLYEWNSVFSTHPEMTPASIEIMTAKLFKEVAERGYQSTLYPERVEYLIDQELTLFTISSFVDEFVMNNPVFIAEHEGILYEGTIDELWDRFVGERLE